MGHRVDTGFEIASLVFEGLALNLKQLAFAVERDATLCKPLIGLQLGCLQQMARWIISVQGRDPVAQGRQRRKTIVGTDLQLFKAGEVSLPGLDKIGALAFNVGIRQLT